MSSSSPTPPAAPEKAKRTRTRKPKQDAPAPAPAPDAPATEAPVTDPQPGDRRTEDGREEVFCRGWSAGGIAPHWQDAEKFFADRKNGGRHWTARCTDCEKAYRSAAKERAEKGERTVQTRGSRKSRPVFRTPAELIEYARVAGIAARANADRDAYFQAVTVTPEPPKAVSAALRIKELEAKIAELASRVS